MLMSNWSDEIHVASVDGQNTCLISTTISQVLLQLGAVLVEQKLTLHLRRLTSILRRGSADTANVLPNTEDQTGTIDIDAAVLSS